MVYTWACRDPAVNLRLPRNGAPPAIWHARCIVAGTPSVLTLQQGGPAAPPISRRPTLPRPPPISSPRRTPHPRAGARIADRPTAAGTSEERRRGKGGGPT